MIRQIDISCRRRRHRYRRGEATAWEVVGGSVPFDTCISNMSGGAGGVRTFGGQHENSFGGGGCRCWWCCWWLCDEMTAMI